MTTIDKLETFSNEFVCFVRVTANTGAIGWGQTSTYNADITATIFHRQIAPWVLGRNALDIDALVERIEEREHKFPGSYRCRRRTARSLAARSSAGSRGRSGPTRRAS